MHPFPLPPSIPAPFLPLLSIYRKRTLTHLACGRLPVRMFIFLEANFFCILPRKVDCNPSSPSIRAVTFSNFAILAFDQDRGDRSGSGKDRLKAQFDSDEWCRLRDSRILLCSRIDFTQNGVFSQGTALIENRFCPKTESCNLPFPDRPIRKEYKASERASRQ